MRTDITPPVAFVCYDYLLTSGREVQYIWRRGFSGPALLFYTLRYATLCNVLFAVTDLKPWANMSDHVRSYTTFSASDAYRRASSTGVRSSSLQNT